MFFIINNNAYKKWKEKKVNINKKQTQNLSQRRFSPITLIGYTISNVNKILLEKKINQEKRFPFLWALQIYGWGVEW